MKTYTLTAEQFVPRPLPEVFAFFERPENLAKITPPSLGFVIVTPTPIAMNAGALIDYTIKVMGLRLRWRTLISHYDPPHAFVDEQINGPYRLWHHRHSFREVEGGTLISDEVKYALPLGILGRIAHSLFVKRQLRGIFAYRAEVIGEKFNQALQNTR
ncbi:MAG: SRPBCC family protein [candidate division Zixibacteria bacterium]|nr:SRPBCC family protein [candidate division Zixibacteria bacterium]